VAEIDDRELPFSEHLTELRTRLIRAIVAILCLFVVTFAFKERLFALLRAPMDKAFGLARLMDADFPERLPTMHVKDPVEAFFTYLKVAFLAAIFLAVPIILYQGWKFVAPGLYEQERKATFPFIFVSTLMFAAGAAFCYLAVLPYGYGYLLTYTGADIIPTIMMREYLTLTAKLLLAFGLVFELPVVLVFLARIGLVTPAALIGFRKYAMVLTFVLAAMLTPPDIITQIALAVPLITLYEISIWGAKVFGKERRGSKPGSDLPT
jgi:sec-independent protein translocase protein TatC